MNYVRYIIGAFPGSCDLMSGHKSVTNVLCETFNSRNASLPLWKTSFIYVTVHILNVN